MDNTDFEPELKYIAALLVEVERTAAYDESLRPTFGLLAASPGLISKPAILSRTSRYTIASNGLSTNAGGAPLIPINDSLG